MTELVALTATGVTGILTAGATIVAVVDPSVTNIVGVVIGGIVTVTMGVIAYKTVVLNQKVDAQQGKIDLTLQKTAVIEGHVNSKETALTGEISALKKENALLWEMVADKTVTAALLAQSTAAIRLPVVAAPLESASKNLQNIDANTEKIERNTANTEAKVDEAARKAGN